MGICHLSLNTKLLDKLWLGHSFKMTTPFSPLIFMASLPNYQKTYLLCTIIPEYSAAVKRNKANVDRLNASSKILFTPAKGR